MNALQKVESKQEYQKRMNDTCQELLKKISIKCENFASKNLNTWHGDLGSVLENLEHVNTFLNDQYLTK